MLTSSADDTSSNEVGRNPLQIDVKLPDGEKADQALFVKATKEAHEVAYLAQQALNRVDLNFADAITIIVARPFI